MSKESKTARASAVREVSGKAVIPDADLIKNLRNDRASKLYPTVQGTDALLRAYDLLLETGAVKQKTIELAAAKIAELEALVAEYQTREVVQADIVKQAPYADQLQSISTATCYVRWKML